MATQAEQGNNCCFPRLGKIFDTKTVHFLLKNVGKREVIYLFSGIVYVVLMSLNCICNIDNTLQTP